MQTLSQRKALQDFGQQSRQDFIRRASNEYTNKLEAAIRWLREHNAYALDAGSRKYTPANGRMPQAIIPLRERL